MACNCTLPGATFGKASCTMKFKVEPQARWTRAWTPAQAAWAAGLKVIKCIGFEADEEHRLSRATDRAHSGSGLKDAQRYEYRYYLMDWGWDLERCKAEIADEGLPIPLKSACIFCPNQQACELSDLTPREVARVIRVEANAEPYNETVGGLWRAERKSDHRPASITEYVLAHDIPFMDLKQLELEDPMPLNPACSMARMGHTFRPPFKGTTLASQLIRARLENEAHAVLVEAL